MKTKAKATHKYIVDLWGTKYYGDKLVLKSNIFRGIVSDIKTGKQYFFNNAVGFLGAMDELYRHSEGKKSTKAYKIKKK